MLPKPEFYFGELSERQKTQFEELLPLYQYWNTRINLISRKDLENFYERHVLHSLSLAFVWKPKPSSKALDIGTGGGFPGIPLAILYPDINFTLVDSIGKKVMVVEEVAKELGLRNVKAVQARAEKVSGTFDVTLSRAVAKLSVLARYCVQSRIKTEDLYCLKGGDLMDEISEIRYPVETFSLKDYFETEFFETKKIVHVRFRKN